MGTQAVCVEGDAKVRLGRGWLLRPDLELTRPRRQGSRGQSDLSFLFPPFSSFLLSQK